MRKPELIFRLNILPKVINSAIFETFEPERNKIYKQIMYCFCYACVSLSLCVYVCLCSSSSPVTSSVFYVVLKSVFKNSSASWFTKILSFCIVYKQTFSDLLFETVSSHSFVFGRFYKNHKL